MQKKQDVIRYEPPQCPDLGGEEVGRDQHVQMRADKLLPRSRRLPLWGWWEAVALENVPHRLVTDRIAQIRQRSSNAIIAPGTIVLSHADNQGLQLWVYFGTTGSLALGGAIKFLGDELAMPGE